MSLVSGQKRDVNASTSSGQAMGRTVRFEHLPSLPGLGSQFAVFPALKSLCENEAAATRLDDFSHFTAG